MGAFSNVKGLSFYKDNNDDPYITMKEVLTSSCVLGMALKMPRTMWKPRETSCVSIRRTQ